MSKTDKTFIYGVEGRGRFPIDMLRYDRATPATAGDASLIEHTLTDSGRSSHRIATFVRIRSDKEPTEGRWSSFGWTVIRDA